MICSVCKQSYEADTEGTDDESATFVCRLHYDSVSRHGVDTDVEYSTYIPERI